MRPGALWRFSVVILPEAEAAVLELVQAAFRQPAAAYTDVKAALSTVSVYLPRKPDRSDPRLAAVKAGLRRVRACGLKAGPGRISIHQVRRQHWAESWKRHFPPLHVGPTLLVKPTWCRLRPRRGQAVVVLDPGMSFGTGRHPTTAFCLRQLARRHPGGQAQSFLDIGTGSGILAIAAARLGYGPVAGFDCDADAVRIARANARLNGVAGRVRFFQQDLRRLGRRPAERYAVVCANLTADLLLSELARIVARLQPGGRLILAGILASEFPRVRRAGEAAGLRFVTGRTENEWRSAAFKKLPGSNRPA